MVSSLPNLIGNLAEEIHEIEYKDCDCFLNMKVSMTI